MACRDRGCDAAFSRPRWFLVILVTSSGLILWSLLASDVPVVTSTTAEGASIPSRRSLQVLGKADGAESSDTASAIARRTDEGLSFSSDDLKSSDDDKPHKDIVKIPHSEASAILESQAEHEEAPAIQETKDDTDADDEEEDKDADDEEDEVAPHAKKGHKKKKAAAGEGLAKPPPPVPPTLEPKDRGTAAASATVDTAATVVSPRATPVVSPRAPLVTTKSAAAIAGLKPPGTTKSAAAIAGLKLTTTLADESAAASAAVTTTLADESAAATAVLTTTLEGASTTGLISFRIPTILPAGNASMRETQENLERSPVVLFAKAVYDFLDSPSSPQVAIGGVATFFGFCMVAFGSMAWQYLYSFFVTIAVGLFVSYQDETLKLSPGPIGDGVLVLQVSIVMGVATFLGFEGSQMLLGSVVGLLAAYATDPLAASWEKEFPWASFAWFCAGAAVGGIIFTAFRTSSLATLAPLVGGFLLVSGAGTLITWLASAFLMAKHSTWIDAASGLFGSMGGAGMVGQCLLALLSAMVFNATGSGGKSVIPMALGLGIGALGVSTGFGCKLLNKCPAWLTPPSQNWWWPLLGGWAWAVASVGGASLQLSQLLDEKDKQKSANKKKKGARSSDADANRSQETQALLYQHTIGQNVQTQPQLQSPPGAYGSSHSSDTYLHGYNAGRAAY